MPLRESTVSHCLDEPVYWLILHVCPEAVFNVAFLCYLELQAMELCPTSEINLILHWEKKRSVFSSSHFNTITFIQDGMQSSAKDKSREEAECDGGKRVRTGRGEGREVGSGKLWGGECQAGCGGVWSGLVLMCQNQSKGEETAEAELIQQRKSQG